MLLGLLQYEASWVVKSNIESGDGYSDILIETPDRIGVVIEVKYAPDNQLDRWCSRALSQIEEKKYDTLLLEDGMETVIKYGIAFFKKNCRVIKK